jgi:glyoxylase-like metal-dependent hydrolase (beta-lactamase superfamily II)
MLASMNRRDVLTGMTGALSLGALPRLAFCESTGALTTTDLGSGLVAIGGAGANVLAVAGKAAALLVDGGSAARSADLLALLEEHSGARACEILFNTSWRAEHTGANETLSASGTKIFAHENTKLWLGADFDVDWEQRHYEPRPKAALPTDTFYVSGALDFDGRKVEYQYLPRAHTDGDVAVFFPDANVLAVGSLVTVGSYPVIDYATGGWIGGLQAATKALLDATDRATKIVPAQGPVCGRAELEAQLALCKAVRDRVADAYRRGLSFTEFVATKPTAEFDAQRGDPAQFLLLAHKGAWGHIRELGGVI